MGALRLLLPGPAVVGDLDDDRADAVQALADLYAYPDPVPRHGWVRANMVTTLDGSATGANGLSGTIGGAADRAVFGALRGLADVVVVGAGTVRDEGYHRPAPQPGFAERRAARGQAPAPALAIVTRSGKLPAAQELFAAGADSYLVTCSAADVDGLRAQVGAKRVVVAGEDAVDPVIAAAQLAARGMPRILLEGGPTLLGRFEAAGRVDELCLTISPILVGRRGPRIAVGDPAALKLRPAHLIESGGVLLGRWLVQPT
ncbi:MAG TPA: dihydrofolate reductase family protein [Kineosporiaceae bacterium]